MTIHPKVKQVAQFVIDRGKEASTWAGVGSVAVLVHIHLNVQEVSGLTAFGVGLCSVLAIIIKEG